MAEQLKAAALLAGFKKLYEAIDSCVDLTPELLLDSKRLIEEAEAADAVPREWRSALRKLAFMARTSGGTAGPDAGLMAALVEAEDLLAAPYVLAAAPQPASEPQPATESPSMSLLVCLTCRHLDSPQGTEPCNSCINSAQHFGSKYTRWQAK